jgi:hypothetical protein
MTQQLTYGPEEILFKPIKALIGYHALTVFRKRPVRRRMQGVVGAGS